MPALSVAGCFRGRNERLRNPHDLGCGNQLVIPVPKGILIEGNIWRIRTGLPGIERFRNSFTVQRSMQGSTRGGLPFPHCKRNEKVAIKKISPFIMSIFTSFKVRSRQRRNRRGKDPEGLALPSARTGRGLLDVRKARSRRGLRFLVQGPGRGLD